MKKVIFIIVLALLTLGCSSKAKLYQMKIDVASKKANRQDWDMMGNAPDIQVYIDKHPMPLMQRCNDTYRCTIGFSSVKDSWYIEVYDNDLGSNDLIAKGDCKEGELCDLGLAKVLIMD
jgi:hypothetical protein